MPPSHYAKTFPTGTASDMEIARFSKMAEGWWDPNGDLRPLHRMNPIRIEFIRDRVCAHFGRDPLSPLPLRDLRVLDIGCGGGLLAEPMARLGAHVTGIDAASETIDVARLHAGQQGLDIEYVCARPEEFARQQRTFDVVLNMEVVEHVRDPHAFFAASAAVVAVQGVMVVATMSRTLKSLALAKIGAEYILRWLPAGTHDWRKFVKPSELARALSPNGVDVVECKGMTYNPLTDRWSLTDDLAVNYIAFAVKR